MKLTRINVVFDEQELYLFSVAINDYVNHDGRHRSDSKEVNAVFEKMMQNSYTRDKNIETPFGVV